MTLVGHYDVDELVLLELPLQMLDPYHLPQDILLRC
jgi:hypothetical protein